MVLFLFLAFLVFLMLLGVPIAFALGISSAVYIFVSGNSFSMLVQSMVRGCNSFTMLAVPFFFLAGDLMNTSGVTDRIIRMAKALVGHMKGGLAQVNIVASVFFAGVSGSATADTAALGKTLIPAMEKEGYDKDFSAAITVASSVVGPIIPPSITLVLYGVVTKTDVSRLLMAGIVPGLLIALFQMIYTHFYAIKMDYPRSEKADLREIGQALRGGISALVMPLIIIGGTMFGVFTPTEAAAVAVIYGIFVGVFIYKNLSWKMLWEAFKNVGEASMSNMFILACAACFSWVLTMVRAPQAILAAMLKITNDKFLLTLMIMVLLIIVGFFMQASQALIILAPILQPLAQSIGIDPVHFGLVMVVILTFGGCTPPVGSLLFVVCKVGNIKFSRLCKAMLPLYIPLLLAIFAITFIPQISLFLPGILFN